MINYTLSIICGIFTLVLVGYLNKDLTTVEALTIYLLTQISSHQFFIAADNK